MPDCSFIANGPPFLRINELDGMQGRVLEMALGGPAWICQNGSGQQSDKETQIRPKP